MALTAAERERVRYHLGYLNTAAAASLTFGIPKPIQTLFLVEQAMTDLLVVAEPRVRNILCRLDNIETRLDQALDTLDAAQIGELRLRTGKAGESTPDLLEREYIRWAGRLADQLGVPLYPYSKRFSNAGNSVNVPVY